MITSLFCRDFKILLQPASPKQLHRAERKALGNKYVNVKPLMMM